MFRQVVAAVDGSPASFRAASLGAQLASAEDGVIDLLTVVPGRSDLAARFGLNQQAAQGAWERAQAELRSARAVIDAPAPIRRAEVVTGPVVDCILSFCGADEERRLLCVGAGRHRSRLGSVSAAVLRQAECPVLVVREGTSRGPRIERLLLAYDGSPGAASALDFTVELVRRIGGDAYLVWVLTPPLPVPPGGLNLSPAEIEKLAGAPEVEDLRRAERRIEEAGGEVVRSTFEIGQPADRILARAEGWDVDLILVGARGRSPIARRFLGGTSDRVAALSTRPVLVVR